MNWLSHEKLRREHYQKDQYSFWGSFSYLILTSGHKEVIEDLSDLLQPSVGSHSKQYKDVLSLSLIFPLQSALDWAIPAQKKYISLLLSLFTKFRPTYKRRYTEKYTFVCLFFFHFSALASLFEAKRLAPSKCCATLEKNVNIFAIEFHQAHCRKNLRYLNMPG